MKTVVLERDDIYKGPLRLVNAKYPLKTGSEMILTPFQAGNQAVLLEMKAATLLSQLLKAAGCIDEIIPVSGYRSRAEQEMIYQDAVNDHGVDFASRFVALPDCSEHQTGLSVDLSENTGTIDYLRPSFPYDGKYGQFRRLAPRYGYIERYGPDKEKLTGIAHEPWHFRYVGYPHAAIMNENNMCLEEYADYIRAFSCDRKRLRFGDTEVFYSNAERARAGFELHENACFQTSGNNIDGFIVTVWRVSS
jgi:D-alanyl-D-alanine dipeptidase/carboxypeptidase